jgi:hypothetical protein
VGAVLTTTAVPVAVVGLLAYVVTDLAPGTWYFSITALNSAGVQSGDSAIVSTTL